MDSQRNLFLITLLFVSFMIWQAWQTDHAPQPTSQTTQQTASATNGHTTNKAMSGGRSGKLITASSDVLSLKINTRGGDIEQALLKAYPKTLGSNQPFQLLETTSNFIYQAQSGLTGKSGPDNPTNGERPLFQAESSTFTMPEGQLELRIPMTYTAANGAIYTKTFVIKRGSYAVDVEYDINNTTTTPLQLAPFGQLKQTIEPPKQRNTGSNNFALHTFRGAAYSSGEDKYQKYAFSKSEVLNVTTQGGWIAMLQQYFATAWIPSARDTSTFFTSTNEGISSIGFKGAPFTIAPGTQKQVAFTLWVGPEIQEKMAAIAPHLDLTVDYGWLWFISQPLFKLLKYIQGFVGNWGFSIIVITFIVRGIMYPLTRAQYTSMAKMRILQPKLTAMRKRIGDDKQRMSHEMMALYKSEKVNPLGGCLPLIVQMPIFLALYYMLSGSIELRHAPFILWIHDLSAQDPCYILPVLMGITMLFIQKMSPTTITDPMQQKIMAFMPIIFTVFFLWFPSGLVLYYIVSNLVTILQQQLIYRGLEKRGLHNRDKKNH